MCNLNYSNLEFQNCFYANKLLNKISLLNRNCFNKVNLTKVKKAIYYCKKYHGNQKRLSGEPYYSHPIEVACMVSDYIFSTDIIISSILHDTIEDTTITKEIIITQFGAKIANQVESLTRVKQGKKITSAEIVQSLYNQKQYDALFIKLLDRLHNIQTIGFKTKQRIKKIAIETLDFFINPALSLELKRTALELQKLCNKQLCSR